MLVVALLLAAALGDARPNDNRVAAGRLAAGALKIRMVAQQAMFYPETKRGPGIPVYAFAEEGKPSTVPGPLVRVPAGTEVQLTLRNALPKALCLRGLQDHSAASLDCIEVAPGETRTIRFRANTAGTFPYWARTEQDRVGFGWVQDSQLAGAFVVDPPQTVAARGERLMVLSLYEDTLQVNGAPVYRRAFTVNGLAWPWTERLTYTTGDTVRFRVINVSSAPHPMHLHGFYYDIDSKGDATRDTIYTSDHWHKVVTEPMSVGSTMSMSWVPTRPGNWLFHCHLIYHIDASHRMMEHLPSEKAQNHAFSGMAGLVMGIHVKPAPGSRLATRTATRRKVRLFVDERPNVFGAKAGMSYVLQEGVNAPAPDSVIFPSSTITLHRNEPTEITVINRLQSQHASVHWHGIELESFYDGVGGWSGAGTRVAPSIAPGDSFVVRLTPYRAGTFIYHTHVDETIQLTSGLYGSLIVLNEGASRDTTDRTFLIGEAGPSDTPRIPAPPFINGTLTPPPIELRSGTTHRFRFVSISAALPRRMRLVSATGLGQWRALAKDGAELPASQATTRSAQVDLGPGETADFEVRRDTPETLTLEVMTLASRYPPHLMKIPVIVR